MTSSKTKTPNDIGYLLARLAGTSRPPTHGEACHAETGAETDAAREEQAKPAKTAAQERDILRRLAINWSGDATARDLADLEILCSIRRGAPASQAPQGPDGPTLCLKAAVLIAYATFSEGEDLPALPAPGEDGTNAAFAWQCLNAGLFTLDEAKTRDDALFLDQLDAAAAAALAGLLLPCPAPATS